MQKHKMKVLPAKALLLPVPFEQWIINPLQRCWFDSKETDNDVMSWVTPVTKNWTHRDGIKENVSVPINILQPTRTNKAQITLFSLFSPKNLFPQINVQSYPFSSHPRSQTGILIWNNTSYFNIRVIDTFMVYHQAFSKVLFLYVYFYISTIILSIATLMQTLK